MDREPLPFDLIADPDYEPEEDQDATQLAVAVLTDLLHLMRVTADVSAREPETPMDGLNHAVAVLDITSPDDGPALEALIGRHGEHLAALQYIVNLIVNRALEGRHAFTVDVHGHKRRREEEIQATAKAAADEVRESHETVELEPMPAAERRIIHITLADDPDVATESAGAGNARRVQIVYRDA
jgi:spoIIIJ-associated protein